LERRWHAALPRVIEGDTHLTPLHSPPVTRRAAPRQRVRSVGQDLKMVWPHAAASGPRNNRRRRTVLPARSVVRTAAPPASRWPLHWPGGGRPRDGAPVLCRASRVGRPTPLAVSSCVSFPRSAALPPPPPRSIAGALAPVRGKPGGRPASPVSAPSLGARMAPPAKPGGRSPKPPNHSRAVSRWSNGAWLRGGCQPARPCQRRPGGFVGPTSTAGRSTLTSIRYALGADAPASRRRQRRGRWRSPMRRVGRRPGYRLAPTRRMAWKDAHHGGPPAVAPPKAQPALVRCRVAAAHREAGPSPSRARAAVPT
jgi:hypothetical protein